MLLVVVTVLTAAALALASRLELRTAFSELLPSNDPGVAALNRTQKRLGDMSLLLVGIHSPNPAANERYAESLTGRLRALPKHVADFTVSVRYLGVPATAHPKWFGGSRGRPRRPRMRRQ